MVLHYTFTIEQVTASNDNIVSSVKYSLNVVGSTLVVGLCSIDEYDSIILVALTNDNQQNNSKHC